MVKVSVLIVYTPLRFMRKMTLVSGVNSGIK